jgi:hypothetical protein
MRPETLGRRTGAAPPACTARGTGFDSLTKFKALAGSSGSSSRVDPGDKYAGISVSAAGKNLVLDFGDGDTLTFLNTSSLIADDFVLA